MKILISGGTGFTGKRVLPLLKDRAQVRVLARPTSDVYLAQSLGMEIVRGDWDDSASLQRALSGVDGVINLGSLGFGHGPKFVRALEEAGIKRALFISTTAIFTRLPAASKTPRLEAEAAIKGSGLDWTILRPTMIYGGADDRNMVRLLKFLRCSPLVVIPGNGLSLQRPIHVEDLAQAIVDAFFAPKTIRKSYNLSGPAALTFNQIIETAARALGKRPLKLHIPVRPLLPLVKLEEKLAKALGLKFFIKEEQVLRLLEDKSFDFTEAKADFAFSPRSFEQGIRQEVASTWPKQKGE